MMAKTGHDLFIRAMKVLERRLESLRRENGREGG